MYYEARLIRNLDGVPSINDTVIIEADTIKQAKERLEKLYAYNYDVFIIGIYKK